MTAYDNATSNEKKARNIKENRFYFGKKNGNWYLIDTNVIMNRDYYYVTEVRQNEK